MHLPGLLPAVHRPSGAELRYRAVPDRYLSFPGFTLGPGQWDELEIPVGLAFLFRNSVLGRTVAFYPGPGRGHRVRAVRCRPGTRWWRPTRSWRLLRADVEALLLRAPERGRAGFTCNLVPIDACYELVGRLRLLWRGFDGGSEAHDAHGRVLRDGDGPQPARRRPCNRRQAMSDLTFSVVDVFAEPYAAAPQLTARLRIEESTDAGDPRDRAALPRSASNRNGVATARTRRAGCSTCSGRGTGGSTPSSRSCGCSAARWSRGSRHHRGRPRDAVHLRLRGDLVEVPARAARGDDPGRLSVLRDRVHPRRERLRRANRSHGTGRRRTRSRSRCGRT